MHPPLGNIYNGFNSNRSFYKSNRVEYHCNHCFMIRSSKPNTLLPGDSIITGLSRYPNVWNEYLAPINALDLGIGRDQKCSTSSHRFKFTVVREKYHNIVPNQ